MAMLIIYNLLLLIKQKTLDLPFKLTSIGAPAETGLMDEEPSKSLWHRL